MKILVSTLSGEVHIAMMRFGFGAFAVAATPALVTTSVMTTRTMLTGPVTTSVPSSRLIVGYRELRTISTSLRRRGLHLSPCSAIGNFKILGAYLALNFGHYTVWLDYFI